MRNEGRPTKLAALARSRKEQREREEKRIKLEPQIDDVVAARRDSCDAEPTPPPPVIAVSALHENTSNNEDPACNNDMRVDTSHKAEPGAATVSVEQTFDPPTNDDTDELYSRLACLSISPAKISTTIPLDDLLAPESSFSQSLCCTVASPSALNSTSSDQALPVYKIEHKYLAAFDHSLSSKKDRALA